MMIRMTGKLARYSLAIALLAGASLRILAQDATTNNPPVPTVEKVEKVEKKHEKSRPASFTGKLGAVDKVAMTFTLDDKKHRTFVVTSETIILTNGLPAIFSDAILGEPVRGAYHKADDGKLMALEVNFGAKAKAHKKPAKLKKEAVKKETESVTNAPPGGVMNAPAPSVTNAPAVSGTNAPTPN